MTPTNFNDPRHSRKMPRDLADVINQDPSVDVIFFNDPEIEGVKPSKGHNGHMHVRYQQGK